MTATQLSKAEEFHALHFTGKPLLLPNVWDGMSTAACVTVGFEALATTSSGIAWSLGYRDGEHMPLAEMIAAIRRIARVAGDVPLTADIEGGYARTDEELAETIAAVINARVDVYLSANDDEHTRDQEALTRCKAYLAAGADCVFPIGLVDVKKLGMLVGELNSPVNAIQSQGQTPYEMFCAAGVARVSTASMLALTNYDYLCRAARDLTEPSRFTAMRTEATYPQMQNLFA